MYPKYRALEGNKRNLGKGNGVNYDREYNDLLRTAEEAVGLIEPGDDVIAGMAAGEPAALIEAMGGHEGFSDNRLYVFLPTHEPPVDVDREKLQIVSMYLSPIDRGDFAEGRIDLLPNHFSQVPELLPPDHEGARGHGDRLADGR
jgi:acyl-CoA hydrolase